MRKTKALKAIDEHGILLVYPLENASDPPSLWSVAYPGEKMSWEWDDEGDDRVADLWHVRAELSSSRKAIYTKWYKGRATFLSLPVFQAMLALSLKTEHDRLSRHAADILSLLEERSPISTKQLKKAANLVGRALEPTYQKALKELWERFLIVAYGEVDEGAFPSLAIGATNQLFEDLYSEAQAMPAESAKKIVFEKLRRSKAFADFYQKSRSPMRRGSAKLKI